jgi:hypothetical protein
MTKRKQYHYTTAQVQGLIVGVIIIMMCVHHTRIVRARPLPREMQSRGQNANEKLNKKLTMREMSQGDAISFSL